MAEHLANEANLARCGGNFVVAGVLFAGGWQRNKLLGQARPAKCLDSAEIEAVRPPENCRPLVFVLPTGSTQVITGVSRDRGEMTAFGCRAVVQPTIITLGLSALCDAQYRARISGAAHLITLGGQESLIVASTRIGVVTYHVRR